MAVLGCEALTDFPESLFDGPSARERYAARLESAGLSGTALGRDWLAAGERALQEAPLVTSPHVEEGFLPPGEPAALAFRATVRRGQRVVFEIQIVGDTTTMVFLDAWRIEREESPPYRHEAAADSGSRVLTFAPDEDGEFVLRAQPELLRGGRFALRFRVAPTLAFPVPDAGEAGIKSGFGAPRDGGRREHHGIDIFARRGSAVVAAGPAVVSHVGTSTLGGKVVWLRDEQGDALYYAHLDSQVVARGDRVEPGDTIGLVGNTGNAITTPPHLHFGIYRPGEGPVDPQWFVRSPRGAVPRLRADTTLLGGLGRTSGRVALRAGPCDCADTVASLPQHTALRVLSAIGGWFRVRLPNGTAGYVASRSIAPANAPVAVARLVVERPVLAHPREPSAAGEVIARAEAGDTLAVLGRFQGFRLVRTGGGRAGWLPPDDWPSVSLGSGSGS